MDPFAREVSAWAAFAAGILSFISPCILPIIPSYMCFISGTTASTLAEEAEVSKVQRRTLLSALAFIAGFSLIFITLGAAATSLGQMVKSQQTLFRQLGGLVVIVLGLHMTGLIQIKPLLYEKRIHLKARPPGYMGAFLIGLSFAVGWTPCIGPILGTILGIAGTQDSVSNGIYLLTLYSLGLAIPFLMTALLMDKIFIHFKKLQKHMQAITVGSGVFLIGVGILIFSNMLQQISNVLQGSGL